MKSSQKHKPQLIAVVIGTRSITRAAVVVPGTFQSTASTNTPPADSTTRNTPLPTSITSNDIISSESSNLNNNQTIVSERQPINSNNSIVDLGSTPTVMSQLQKSNPFGELSALAARIKLKATISGAHRLLPQQKTLLNQSSSSLTNQYSILPVDPLSKHYKGLPVLTRSLLSVIEIQPGPFVVLESCQSQYLRKRDRDTDDYKQTEELQILHCDAELRSILVGFP
ncbi:5782_t:CDS:2, partial [Entrophospora sp. SA101]